jgi:hypothetical protein
MTFTGFWFIDAGMVWFLCGAFGGISVDFWPGRQPARRSGTAMGDQLAGRAEENGNGYLWMAFWVDHLVA